MIKMLPFFVLLLADPLNAQHANFPLHIGNTWQWSRVVDPSPNNPTPAVWQRTIVGDTLMPNGHHYAVEDEGGTISYIRQQGDSVFIWSPDGEWLYFNFSVAPGDTQVTNGGVPGNTLLVMTMSRDTLMTFGARRCVWYFWMTSPGKFDDERGCRVVDGIGLTDIDVAWGVPVQFQGARVNGVVYGILAGVEVRKEEVPDGFVLEQNYPNPFNPSTVIKFDVGGTVGDGRGANPVRLAVYDLLGRQVAVLVDEKKASGSYEVTFDGSGLSSGVYFYRMEAGSFTDTKKLLLIR